jgi:SpoVK/Ycf46/Vps4 family AAA+-type ATPase
MTLSAKSELNADLYYKNTEDHLHDELKKLDLLIARRVALLRALRRTESGMPATKGLYISDVEVDELLDEAEVPLDKFRASTGFDKHIALFQQTIDEKIAGSIDREVTLTLPRLAALFALSPFELQTIVICLAPELRRKYDTLYAYVQDDITRKKPSVDLVLEILCASEEERWHARTAVFSDQAPLFRHTILHRIDDLGSPSGSSGLSQFLQLDRRIFHYLLDNHALDGRLAEYANWLVPSAHVTQAWTEPSLKARLTNLCRDRIAQLTSRRRPFVFYLQGPDGVGKRDLALGLCSQWGRPLLCIDMALLLGRQPDAAPVMRLLFREAQLSAAALFFSNCEILLQEDANAKVWMKTIVRMVGEYPNLTFLTGELPWKLHDGFDQENFCAVELELPDESVRQAVWEQVLRGIASKDRHSLAKELADQFRLTPKQINAATAWLTHQRVMAGEKAKVTRAELYAACRKQSHHKLAEMAVKIEPRYEWADLVLPPDKLEQLREFCSQLVHRRRVFGDWGFARKLARGRGISAIFAGPSGTGKTMAAEVIAHELRLDLYKIDLSSVVNKYIGETEKNLSRIFHEAEGSNAILFFDEADALFGKRTKISDAHDRYANVETSYLLQRVEEYEGIVILATNLRDNMDEAFTRRIRFIVDFPFPDSTSRKIIWQTHFPRETPVSDNMDYDWLALHLQITGGMIKNIVLNAAFYAAVNDDAVDMPHVLRGARREFEKTGKVWNGQLYIKSGQ